MIAHCLVASYNACTARAGGSRFGQFARRIDSRASHCGGLKRLQRKCCASHPDPCFQIGTQATRFLRRRESIGAAFTKPNSGIACQFTRRRWLARKRSFSCRLSFAGIRVRDPARHSSSAIPKTTFFTITAVAVLPGSVDRRAPRAHMNGRTEPIARSQKDTDRSDRAGKRWHMSLRSGFRSI